MPFRPGQSGNPKGRPKGVLNHARLREAIAKDLPEILKGLAAAAKAGDTTAAKLLLDRALPALKPTEPAAPFPVRPGLADTGRELLERIGAAQMSSEQGGKLLGALASLARIVEVDELIRRVAELEKRLDEPRSAYPR